MGNQVPLSYSIHVNIEAKLHVAFSSLSSLNLALCNLVTYKLIQKGCVPDNQYTVVG